MRLDKIRLHEIGPFHDFAVDFSAFGDAKLICICGGNGSGKTTLLEAALPGALYRVCPTRGRLTELARARDSYVEATVTNGATFTIRHSVDAVSKKGEALVLDAAGCPVLPSTGVAAFDAWAERYLPKPEVLFTSIFAAQQSGGFLGLSAGERKSVLLRTLGIERYEVLADLARKHASEVKNQIETLRARIEDERQRGGDVADIELQLCGLQDAETLAAALLVDARGALEIGQLEKPALELARREAKAAREKRADLQTRIAAKTAERGQLEVKIQNNRGVLADAEKIRAAKTRYDELTTEIARLEEQIKASSMRRMHAIHERDRQLAAAKAANARAKTAQGRVAAARVRLGNRTQIDAATAALPALEKVVQVALDVELEAATALEKTRAQRLAGADERITGLRGGLVEITTTFAPPDDLQGIARDALTVDDGAVEAASEYPRALEAAQDALTTAGRAVVTARKALDAARALAARAPELEAAEREIEEQSKDAEAAKAEAVEADDARVKAEAATDEHQVTGAGFQRARETAERERALIAPEAAKAGPLANAEGRLAELEPQIENVCKEIAALEATLAATPEPPESPKVPEIATLEADLSRAETAARQATEEVGIARGRLARAKESADQALELQREADRLGEDLSDWTRLATDLGKNGLIAMEIDAVGPSLSEMASELLHSCFGPRWTVSIETTRLSADGKQTIEDCQVRVIDTEHGRDAPADTFSGGEKVILSEAISLSLSMLACQRSGLQGCSIVRDETGAALDPENGRRYVQMLRKAAELVGASRVLFVCHDKAIQELADAVIDVGAPNNPSPAEFERSEFDSDRAEYVRRKYALPNEPEQESVLATVASTFASKAGVAL